MLRGQSAIGMAKPKTNRFWLRLRRCAVVVGLLLPVIAMPTSPTFLKYKSQFDVTVTLDRLTQLATNKGLQIFARIDFASDAHRVGLELRAEQLLIFGNPRSGTALLQSSPSVGGSAFEGTGVRRFRRYDVGGRERSSLHYCEAWRCAGPESKYRRNALTRRRCDRRIVD